MVPGCARLPANALHLLPHRATAIGSVGIEVDSHNLGIEVIEIELHLKYVLLTTTIAFISPKCNVAHFCSRPCCQSTMCLPIAPLSAMRKLPGDAAPGHFGLAVKDYAHSTAPNRRYTDVITQRLLKAAIEGTPSPYTGDELVVLATHCSKEENAANKVERQVGKSAAALLLQSRIGEQFDAIVTGAAM